MFRHSDTAQCSFFFGKSDDSHKVPLTQSSALSDIPILTACHSTKTSLYNSNK